MLGKLWNLLPVETLHGYENPELIDVVFQKTVAYRPSTPRLDFAKALTVLDFGGGCGIHYKQGANPDGRWAVVETPAMTARAKELETDKLRFFTEIDDAASWLGPINIMHSAGAIQYTPDPLSVVKKLCGLMANRMLWSRLFLGEGSEVQISRLQDNGPGKIPTPRKKVAYPFKRIPKSDFLAAHGGYRLTAEGDDWFQFSR